MTSIQCLVWMRDNGYRILAWPTETIAGCTRSMSIEAMDDAIERRSRPDWGPLGDERHFIEIAPNGRGEMGAWVYTYPRPACLESDISVAMPPRETCLPPERQVPFEGDEGWCIAPYKCFGLRQDDA